MAIYEYGFPALATPFMQRALAIASQWEDQHREVKALLGSAILAFRIGENGLTAKICSRILQHPGTDAIRAAGATSFLALAYEQDGELGKAVDCLRQAAQAAGPALPPLALISQLGLKARFLRQLGHLESARDLYEQILQVRRPHASPRYRSFILLHLAGVLVDLGETPAISELSRDLESLVSELEDTPAAREILTGLLIAILCSGPPGLRIDLALRLFDYLIEIEPATWHNPAASSGYLREQRAGAATVLGVTGPMQRRECCRMTPKTQLPTGTDQERRRQSRVQSAVERLLSELDEIRSL